MKITSSFSALIFALVAAIAPVAGQQDAAHPDFSGTWKLNSKKSDISAKSPLAAMTMVISCNGLTIDMRHASVIDGHEIIQIFVADGQPRTVKESPGLEMETKAVWEKSTLVVVKTSHDLLGPHKHPGVITSRWSLSKDGKTLKSEARTSGWSRTDVYDRQ